jgi:DNA-binding LacI/PurR family transcriptional regulator
MVTNYDISKKTGVSAATISKVLNAYTDVSAKTAMKFRGFATKWAIDPIQLLGAKPPKNNRPLESFLLITLIQSLDTHFYKIFLQA